MKPDRTIVVPFTVTGGVSTAANRGVNTLSGFTNSLTRFEFTVTDTHSEPISAITNDIYLWDLGDGTNSR